MTPKLIRCFIALTLANDTQAKLTGIQKQLKECGAKARWVKTENIHITLRFLGNRSSKRVKQIIKAFPMMLEQIPKFNITLDTLDAFPNIDEPNVLWINISKGSKNIVALHDQVNNSLAKIGIPKDREKFMPHLTIARCKTPGEIQATAQAVKKAPTFSIEASPPFITFYQSTLCSKGSIHESLASIHFRQ